MANNKLIGVINESPSFNTLPVNGGAQLDPKHAAGRVSVFESLLLDDDVEILHFIDAIKTDKKIEAAVAEFLSSDLSTLSEGAAKFFYDISRNKDMVDNELISDAILKSTLNLTHGFLNSDVYPELNTDIKNVESLKVMQGVVIPLLSRVNSLDIDKRLEYVNNELASLGSGELGVSSITKVEAERAVIRIQEDLSKDGVDLSLYMADLASGVTLNNEMSKLSHKYGSGGDVDAFKDDVASALLSLSNAPEVFQLNMDDEGFVRNAFKFADLERMEPSEKHRSKRLMISGNVRDADDDMGLLVGSEPEVDDNLSYLDKQVYTKQLRDAELEWLNSGAKVVPKYSLANKIKNYFGEEDPSRARELNVVGDDGLLLLSHSSESNSSTYTRIPDGQLNNPKVLKFAALKAKEAGVSPVYIHPPKSKQVSKEQKESFVYEAAKALLEIGYDPAEIQVSGMIDSRTFKQALDRAIKEHEDRMKLRSGVLSADGDLADFDSKLKDSVRGFDDKVKVAGESKPKKDIRLKRNTP